MNRTFRLSLLTTALGGFFALASCNSVAGTAYRFRVSCPASAHVVEWRTGDIDPGKEYLRVATGTANVGCSISDFDATRDAGLRVQVLKGADAIGGGLQPVFVILGAWLGIKLF